MIITIHQPNFFPYYPFFQKMEMSEKFVLLTDCQYEKNGFQNRFNLGGSWHTMSAQKGLTRISEKKYVNHLADWQKIKISLKKYEDILVLFDDCISDSLAQTNIRIIRKAAALLDIKTEIVVDEPTNFNSTERLVELCKRNGGTKYVSGISGKKYLDMELFEKSGVEVIFQDENKMSKDALLDKLLTIKPT